MLAPAEITKGFSAERVSAALKRAASKAPHRRQWIDEQADALDILPDTFESYFYAKTTPGLDAFQKMVAHFGPEFASEVLRPTGVVCIKASDLEIIESGELLKALRLLIPQLRGVLEDAETAAQLKVVKK
ncbi:MAG TPA: hypothetical protein ENH55_13480 [Aurantimonas coralicida]|uniref:Uncharacterized protein n=2 Tax=root TaxID=1 RepID=A0A9C9TG07_9HYPH|nr:hypothetical protein [Aurantimonas coralicida]HET99628.1 hypothetical protein [Aurantimonas coralicida]